MKILLLGINSKYIHPSMGIYQLYTNSKYECEFKEFTIKDSNDEIISLINEFDIIGISTYIWNINKIKEILPHIKNKTIILGGPEASFKKELLKEYNVKYIIKGEGEESFNELMDYLNNNISIDKVSNLYYLENDEIKYTYDKLPNLNNVKHDLSLIGDFKNRICYVESSRGCFYNCSYCLASTEKPVRFFPLEEVLSNIKYLLDNNARTIKFLDRSFGIKKEYINGILKFIRDNDNGVSIFQIEVNADSLDSSTIDILNSMRRKQVRLEIGIQSTNPFTIKAINRHQNFDKLKNNVIALRDNCVIHTDLIAGLPYEDYDSFRKSFNDTFLLFTEELQLGFLKELKGTVISLTKDLYDYEFENESPYEVIRNKFISKEELDKIRLVEIGIDKFYNYGYYKRTIKYLFDDLKLNPFDTLLSVTSSIHDIYKLQVDELTKELYLSLVNLVEDKEKLLFIIKEDYLTRTNIKPKIWWNIDITREERKYVYETFSKEFDLNIEELYRYGHLEKNGYEYLLVNYKDNKIYKKWVKF